MQKHYNIYRKKNFLFRLYIISMCKYGIKIKKIFYQTSLENTKSIIISKGISAGKAQNTYRGLVRMGPRATNSRNFTQCDSLLIGDKCGAHTVPYIEVKNKSAQVEHEATTSKISDDQMFYCRQRGLDQENAISLIVNGFCKEVLKELPMEFAVEAQKLLEISLEGSVG